MNSKLDLDEIRGMPLEPVLEGFKCERDPTDPARNWRTPSRNRITVTEKKFYDHDATVGGYGAIDLTMHLFGYDRNNREGFKKAVAWLANIDIDAAIAEMRQHTKDIISTTKVPDPKHEIPDPAPEKIPRVRKYLTEHRRIPEAIVDRAIRNGRLWADGYGNAVFQLTSPDLTGEKVGVELRGTLPDKPFHGARGAVKGFFVTGTTRNMRAVFVEAGVDALSYEAFDQGDLIVSTTGGRKESLQKTARLLHEKGYRIASGFDLDATGERMTRALQEEMGADEMTRLTKSGFDPNATSEQKIRILQEQMGADKAGRLIDSGVDFDATGEKMVKALQEALGADKVDRLTPPRDLLQHYEQMTGKPGKDWNDALRARDDRERHPPAKSQKETERGSERSEERSR